MQNTDIGYMIKCLDHRLRAQADANMAEGGLTYVQVRVLKIIWEHGGEVTQRRIEAELNVSHPTVVGIVDRLGKNGYVDCRTDPSDHRNKLVRATEKARQHREWHDAQVKKTEHRITAGFSPEELEILRAMLTRLYANLE